LINLNKTTNVTVGFYGNQAAEFEIERDCLKYIQNVAYAE
jgi:hypothetical protein